MSVATLHILAEDIVEGQKNPNSRIRTCAVYISAKRVIPNVAHVSTTHIVLSNSTRIPLPVEGIEFIRKADIQASVARGVLKYDPNDVDMEPLKPFKLQVQYTETVIV